MFATDYYVILNVNKKLTDQNCNQLQLGLSFSAQSCWRVFSCVCWFHYCNAIKIHAKYLGGKQMN